MTGEPLAASLGPRQQLGGPRTPAAQNLTVKALFVHRELISVLDNHTPGSEREHLFFLCLGEVGELGSALGSALTQT